MKYQTLGAEIGALVDVKQQQYGDSFSKCGEHLKILYPNGVQPEQYTDMLALVRIFDKQMRIANGSQGEESPYRDIAGYALLGENHEREPQPLLKHKCKHWYKCEVCEENKP